MHFGTNKNYFFMPGKSPPLSVQSRWPLLIFQLTLLVSIPTIASETRQIPAPQIHVAGEELVGRWQEPGLASFKSIPYAMAPTGERRWRPPLPAIARSGTLDHSTFKAACPQRPTNHAWYANVARHFGIPETGLGELETISEDCLHLNVWTRNLSGAALQPVMVWIHGGSNIDGYSNEPNYDGQQLTSQGVVVVSINYRLGVLGFLAHPALTAESAESSSGHWGFLDQIAALKWIQANIHRFGGDAKRITVFGESAGAADIGTLLISPLAKGLFSQAIIQSGGYPINSFETLAEGELMGMQLTDYLTIPASDTQAKQMRALHWKTLVYAVPKALDDYYFDARIDEWLLYEPAALAFAEGRISPIKLIIGANANENYMYIPDSADDKTVQAQLDKFAPYQTKIAAQLASLTPRQQLDKIGSSNDFICPSIYIATSQASAGLDTYLYYFARVRPDGERILAYHGAEIPYVFNTADEWLPADKIDLYLQAQMLRYWTNFAKNGDPNSEHLPQWPKYDTQQQAYLSFGDTIKVNMRLNQVLCDTLNAVLDNRLDNYLKAHPSNE